MKLNKILAVLGTFALCVSPMIAQEADLPEDAQVEVVENNAEEVSVETKSPLTFSVNVQTAYYPKSDYVAAAEKETHYAPFTGAYSGLEGAITPQMDYVIPTPLGDNWLLNSANLKLSTYLQITPVTVKPGVSATWTPLPFLVFSTGGEAGTGWNVGNIFTGGMGAYDASSNTYNADTPFANWFLKTWFQGTFQFDTGALIPGDWTHILMQYSYQAYYQNYTGAEAQQLWTWQCSGNRVDGWFQYMNAILAYQLPIPVLKLVGVMFESDGAYSDDVYSNESYKGSFKELSLSPLMQFSFGKHSSLTALFHFKSRRAYSSDTYNSDLPDSYKTTNGREWFFNRVAISYTYTF